MARLALYSPDNRSLAEITLDPQNRLQLSTEQVELKRALRAFLDQTQQTGVRQRVSRTIEKDGRTLIAEDTVCVQPGDPDFLKALADEISSMHFARQRIFALVQPDLRKPSHEQHRIE